MSKMNGVMRKKLYSELTQRDGEYCRMCGVVASERQLVVDHRDNNNSNNSSDNHQLLCRKCNYIKNPRRPVDVCESVESQDINELQINRTKEPQFKQYLAQRINESDDYMIQEKDLVNSSAESLGLSPVTTKRYLDKRCSSDGVYTRQRFGNITYVTYKQDSDLK